MLTQPTDRVAQYLAAISRLAPLVAEHRQAFDRERRLPDVVFRELAEAGLFRLWLPEKLGGPGLSPLQFMEVLEAASALDGSVGWLVGNGGGMSRAGGYLPEPVAREYFVDPHAFIASATGAVGTALPCDDGYRVSGRWPFGSGAHHATAFMALATVRDDNGREGAPICCYFPRKDVRIDDTWHVSGLRGTGSCDFETRDALVPRTHTHPLVDFRPTQPGIVYRLPGLGISVDDRQRAARDRPRRDGCVRRCRRRQDARRNDPAGPRDRADDDGPRGGNPSCGPRLPHRGNDEFDRRTGRGCFAAGAGARHASSCLCACRRQRAADRRSAGA